MGLFERDVTIASSGLLNGFTDFHSHLLPGVDDGVQETSRALEILALYEALGITKVWLTPHIMEDVPNTTAHLRERFAQFREEYKGGIELRLASENMLDVLFEQRLAARDLLPVGESGTMLLVETSYYNPPIGLDDILKEIMASGYHPLLAHPERYTYMDEDDYKRLHVMGVRMQVNLPSLIGGYGPEAKQKAEWLINKRLVTHLGTDTHGLRMINMTAYRRELKKSTKRAIIRQQLMYK